MKILEVTYSAPLKKGEEITLALIDNLGNEICRQIKSKAVSFPETTEDVRIHGFATMKGNVRMDFREINVSLRKGDRLTLNMT